MIPDGTSNKFLEKVTKDMAKTFGSSCSRASRHTSNFSLTVKDRGMFTFSSPISPISKVSNKFLSP